MKLLSMKAGGKNNAGIVIGDEVLDVSAYIDSRGATIQRESCVPKEHLEDALDLFHQGIERLQPIVTRIESDRALADEGREAGWLVPLDSVASFKPGVGFSNGSHYVNPEMDKLLETAA